MIKEIAIGIIVAVLFISIILLFLLLLLRLYTRKRIEHKATLLRKEAEYQEAILSSRLETQEQTFEHISQELHDNIGQQITALNFMLENQKIKHPVCREDLDRASASLALIAQQVQHLSHSLNSNWVSERGLVNSIGQELERLRNNTSIEFVFMDETVSTITLSRDKQIILFRVFQEILNNALKHAKASRITVQIGNNDGLYLSIEDNGTGFDVAQQTSLSAGMGLRNIVSRAQIIGFDCTISSKNNTGTAFLLKEIISL